MTLPDNDATRLGDTEPGTDSAAPGSDSRRNALPAGTRLLEFELLEVVGEGGFGIVYRAYDHNLHREVALKEFLPASLAQRAGALKVSVTSQRHAETFAVALRSFVNEARLLARFDHPSLVKVYRFWEANGTAYMVMPYYRVATLSATLRDGRRRMDEPWLARILGDLLDALEVLHSQQCLHRDIAPENILMLEEGRPLLLDFGAARQVIGDTSRALTVIYRPDYAPIEQHAESAAMKQGPWTDLYALSAVAHFAITGAPPPPAVSRLMHDTYVPLAGRAGDRFGARLLEGIDRGLALRPEDRPRSVAAMRKALGLQPSSPPPRREVAQSVHLGAERAVARPDAAARGVFISYRRHDAAGHAGRLFDVLAARLGADRVFMDVTDLRPGQDFVAEVDRALAASDCLLAVIGPKWTEVTDAAGRRRLDDPEDLVVREIAQGLERATTVIPVLVNGARMPAPESLPPTLRPLARRQAIELSDHRWESDVRELVNVLAPEGRGAAFAGGGAKSAPAPESPVRPRASKRVRVLSGAVALIAVLAVGVGLAIRGFQSGEPATTLPALTSSPRPPEPAASTVPVPDARDGPVPAAKERDDGSAVGATQPNVSTQPAPAARPLQTKPEARPPSVASDTAPSGGAGGRTKAVPPRETTSTGRALSPRCADLLNRAQIGEPLSPADMSFLKQQC